jgi:hypothetical protein
MFRLLGTPKEDKRLILYDTGHDIPYSEIVKETLDWLDRYLGPVKSNSHTRLFSTSTPGCACFLGPSNRSGSPAPASARGCGWRRPALRSAVVNRKTAVDTVALFLCRELCRNPATPCLCRVLSLRGTPVQVRAANMPEIRMNTAPLCRLLSLAVLPLQFVEEIDTEEVHGSNPFGPTIFFNHLASSAKFRRSFRPVISYLCLVLVCEIVPDTILPFR